MRKRVTVKKSVIPGIFTLFNLFFGFLAILMASQGFFEKAAWLILAAALFDGLDGATARLFKAPSKFGVEFDSIADLVSFCTAPAVLVYFAFVSDLHPFPAAIISFTPLIAGAFRLARFNIHASETPEPFFIGLPSTASALTFASFILFNHGIFGSPGDSRLALPLVFLLSFLMVSHFRYAKIPYLGRGWHSRVRATILLLCLGGITLWKSLVLFPIAMIYVSTGIMNTLLRHSELEVGLEAKKISESKIGDNT